MRAGAHFIALDFDGVEGTKGDLLPMADQVRRGVVWAYKNAKSFGGDPDRIYVSGHSSGGHLAGCVLTTDWQKDYGVPDSIVKGGMVCSGMYDLRPVRLSKRSDYVDLHRRERGEAFVAAPHRPAQLSTDRGLWQLRDTGISAPGARLRGRREGCRKARDAVGR